MSAERRYQPPTDATALLIHISLAHRLDAMSMRKSADFLPVGKNFTIPIRTFLPVGKHDLQVSGFRPADRTVALAGTTEKGYKPWERNAVWPPISA